MTLDYETMKMLSNILEAIRMNKETPSQRQLLINILDSVAPEELDSFLQRHGFSSVDSLKKYLKEKKDRDLLTGLVIIGAALLTVYLLTRQKGSTRQKA